MNDDGTIDLPEASTEQPVGRLRLLVLWESRSVVVDLPPQGELRIGRAMQADVVVEDASVSRNHVAVEVSAGAILIRDLGSQNGTKINGRKLASGETSPFRPGMLAEIGRAVIVLQPRDATAPSTIDAPLAELPGLVVAGEGPMRQLYRLVSHVAESKISVLLLGETGVGKERVAEAVHRWSPRKDGPLVRLNCAALPETLLESELFGHEKGAFTGAIAAKKGLVEAAHGGTLFLDEIGEMPLSTQAKLLRVLEAREVLPVGGREPRAVDIRLVAATHRDLDAAMRTGTFRADLFYRINGVSIAIPPLRARVSEIADLATMFAARACDEAGRRPVRLSNETLAALRAHAWPGNVRELKNVVERAVALCKADVIEPDHLLEPKLAATSEPRTASLGTDLSEIEKARILDALERFGGNQSQVARELGIPRRTLVRRLKEYGLTKIKDRTDRGGRS
jgi:DNA-binding NtrC family response regulator